MMHSPVGSFLFRLCLAVGVSIALNSVSAAPPPAARVSKAPNIVESPEVAARPPAAEDETLSAAVEIRQRRGDQVELIKRGGRTVSIKVTPAGGGPSYYLIDRLGNGHFSIYDNTVDGVVVPAWVVMQW